MQPRFIVLLFVLLQARSSVSDGECDQNRPQAVEGNLGQAGTFPWLGVIRVHLHEGTMLRIALTGCILVKATHAIAVADDVARIPKSIFTSDSKAMFIPRGNQPWMCGLKDYLLHPEYEYATYNTLAIVELEPGEDTEMPMAPICWPSYLYNASNQLYVLGYTDEKQLLEKVLYRVQYIDKTMCEEFYTRAGLTDHEHTPSHYQCGLAGNNNEDCDWDNGMVLASNSTGNWVLIGLGIRGPGCSAPSRFIEIFQYLPWIETSTSNVQYPDYSYRRSAFGIGFKRRTQEKTKDIPVHTFFRSNLSDVITKPWWERLKKENDSKLSPIKWFFSNHDEAHWKQFHINRIDNESIAIHKFRNKYEKKEGDCSKLFNRLVYSDTMHVHTHNIAKGFGTYQVSLMDLMVEDYTCVTVRIHCEASTDTYLWYKMTLDEPLAELDRTPDYLKIKYPIPKNSSDSDDWDSDQNHEPSFVDERDSWGDQRNVKLFLEFKFVDKAYLKIGVWGPPAPVQKPPRDANSSARYRRRFESQHPSIEASGKRKGLHKMEFEVDRSVGAARVDLTTWNASSGFHMDLGLHIFFAICSLFCKHSTCRF